MPQPARQVLGLARDMDLALLAPHRAAPVGAVTALLGEVGYGRVAVVYVDRVAIGLGLGPYGHQNPQEGDEEQCFFHVDDIGHLS